MNPGIASVATTTARPSQDTHRKTRLAPCEEGEEEAREIVGDHPQEGDAAVPEQLGELGPRRPRRLVMQQPVHHHDPVAEIQQPSDARKEEQQEASENDLPPCRGRLEWKREGRTERQRCAEVDALVVGITHMSTSKIEGNGWVRGLAAGPSGPQLWRVSRRIPLAPALALTALLSISFGLRAAQAVQQPGAQCCTATIRAQVPKGTGTVYLSGSLPSSDPGARMRSP